jgi:hypothetical protein
MQGVSMVTARRDIEGMQKEKNTLASQRLWRRSLSLSAVLGLCILLGVNGCGQTAKTVTSPASGQVDAYFGGPFAVSGSSLATSLATFDHSANQIGVSAFIRGTTLVPTDVLSGGFATADTGFLKITENFATTGAVITAQNPPLTGAWAVEIPGAGALANLLNVTNVGAVSVKAAPAAMAENATCPNFSNPAAFLYVTVPTATQTTDLADYGGVTLTTQGSQVTFRTQPYLIGMPQQSGFNVSGGCSNTNLGALTAFPMNSFGTPSNQELISIGASGLLVSSFNRGATGSSPGAFGGGTGVLGVVQPTGPVDVNAVVGAKYNGFLYSPQNTVAETYDITVLASAFGDNSATSSSCSALETSVAANHGQGAGTVAALPSANSLYGGEFLTTITTGSVNDPTGANGSENCDVIIDLGTQSTTASGVFPNATIFIGSNFPPYSASHPWNCSDTGTICAVAFPAAAVVGQVQGEYVIFVSASAVSTPSARLPDAFGNRQAQPLGIYLFQKKQ